MMNVEQIAYDLRTQNQSLEKQILAKLDLLELDEFEVEPLAIYWEELCALAIPFQNDSVQMAITAHPQNLESAILYVLDINKRLKFESPKHVTNTFVKALREGWKPSTGERLNHHQQ